MDWNSLAQIAQVICAILVPVVGWLFVTVITQGKEIARLEGFQTATNKSNETRFTELSQALRDMNNKLDKISEKMGVK